MPHQPSAFAEWVASREERPGPLVEAGCGNGRDALWFSSQGFDVLGLDYADSAVRLADQTARKQGFNAEFAQLNLYRREAVLASARELALHLQPRIVYARFFVHALEDEGREALWSLARQAMSPGGTLYVESRVAETVHVFGDHFRHFVSTDLICAELEALGAVIDHREEGTGLALYKDEDPRVCRVAAQWASPDAE